MTGVQGDDKFEFSVNDLGDEVTLFMCSESTKPQSISGFPTSIASLIHRQGLDAAFGTSNHSKRKNLETDPPVSTGPYIFLVSF